MKPAAIPDNESDRLKALSEYRILGTRPEESYDDITRMASLVCQTPISLLSLVDKNRQWFKSKVGVDAPETPRDWSFCAHAIHSPEPLVVRDALWDERFHDNPLVCGDPKIRFYAGFPLSNMGGERIGTLCVIDREPGELSAVQVEVMQALARQVMAFLELRKRSIRLMEAFCSSEASPGMIATCSYCRKARNEEGRWVYLDQFLSRHTELQFSHGICDGCIEEHFPDVMNAWKAEEAGAGDKSEPPAAGSPD